MESGIRGGKAHIKRAPFGGESVTRGVHFPEESNQSTLLSGKTFVRLCLSSDHILFLFSCRSVPEEIDSETARQVIHTAEGTEWIIYSEGALV